MLDKTKSQNTGVAIWEMRTEEQPYAKLNDTEVKKENCYGQKIDLIELTGLEKGRSLHINENPAVGDNPNRNKQHGFFFTADNCIGCHACEAACAEKNETPAHLAFRSVGYVEGGSFPDYKRLNISMACNHCDDPVCLKGCPTGAYTKHAEYGAVLQDPDTCFGCGYCTWVCPYNAPQLDPIQGQVSKCNMCVDRLEVGLKPACVSACLGNALDFGVIENIPDNREQAKTSIPGFPNPEITQPNIRFQQTRVLPDEMKRTDSMPVKYHRDEKGMYKPNIDQKEGTERSWNVQRLSSRENPLVLFTLLSQAAIGAFSILFIGGLLGVDTFKLFQQTNMHVPFGMLCLLMVGFGLFMSTMHLGKPLRFYRGFNNLKHSPVCREGLGIAVFMAMLSGYIFFSMPSNPWLSQWLPSIVSVQPTSSLFATMAACLAIPASFTGLYYMNRCYRIKARPFWNHWQVATSFFGNMLSLGSIVAGSLILSTLYLSGVDTKSTLFILGSILWLGILIEGFGLYYHAQAMSESDHEGGASHYVQKTTFGKTYILRNCLMLFSILTAPLLLIQSIPETWQLIAFIVLSSVIITASLISRALFYVLVIPTTMPGAFFWKNKGFEAHAKDIGLANMPQVGVVATEH